MAERAVGVIGASALVGDYLLPLLARSAARVVAYTRRPIERQDADVEWRVLPSTDKICSSIETRVTILDWIVLAPIWVIPEQFALLESCHARRVVALSSTSRFVKDTSRDIGERHVAAKLSEGEAALQAWAARCGVEWLILRPTLIYGSGQDRNIAAAARFIRRFGFFPLVGGGLGLRQPIHAADVAAACVLALQARHLTQRSYNISGGETITYREMIACIFRAMGQEPRFLPLPRHLVRLGVLPLRLMPAFRHVTVTMAERMVSDLVFDHGDATRDFGFAPRPYRLSPQDLSL